MVLKRKRSDSEISTSSSLLSSPLSASNYMSLDNPQSTIPTPSLFSSRTHKRHRDNRPSESAVHQHTLSLLFSAQQNPQPQSQPFTSPSPFPSQTPIASMPPSSQSSQQSSLHSFWAIPESTRHSSPASISSTPGNTPSTTPPHNSFFQAMNCEDCNASLNPADNGNSMDVDMMMDIDTDGGNFGCTSCGKQVCHGCAVSNLGADRRCLMCVKPKQKWVGGLGWMDQD